MRAQLEPLGLEILADIAARPLNEFFVLDDADVFERRRARDRVPRIGVAVVEFAALFDERLGDLVRHHHRADRQVAGRKPLGEAHQIGRDAKSIGAEPLAGAAKAADHFVGDQQNAAFLADPVDLWPIGVRWNDHTAGALDRFADEGGDVVRAQPVDLGFELLCRQKSELLRALVTAEREPVRRLDVVNVRDRQAALRVHRAHAAEARRTHRRAVVAKPPRDDDVAVRHPLRRPIMPDETDHRFVALGA